MAQPAYSFTLPSLENDIAVDVRVYHPVQLSRIVDDVDGRGHAIKGAVLAHPYAPLGGCYDDHVILSVTETLVAHDYVVATFNFRGAGDSQGRTSWMGWGEMQDYVSVVGFMIHYLQHLSRRPSAEVKLPTTSESTESRETTCSSTPGAEPGSIVLTLGGYSYGSLILARLSSVPTIIARFQEAVVGTSAAEIIMRARTLAKDTIDTLQDQQTPTRPRGRSLKPEDAGRESLQSGRPSPVTLGGEETDASERRRSRDSRRSADLVRKSTEIPHRIREHMRKRSDGLDRKPGTPDENVPSPMSSDSTGSPKVTVSYLLISPALWPFTHILLPPGPPVEAWGSRKQTAESTAGTQLLQHPTLAVFGTKDVFTAGRRLRAWAEKQAKDSLQANFVWKQVEGAGHFWRENGVVQDLQTEIASWKSRSSS